VRLAQAGYDPAPGVAAVAGFYHTTGPGAPPTYSLDSLVRAEIVRVWAASCSDRALEQLLASDLVVRWFCRLGLLDPTPDHVTLNRFHAWLGTRDPAALEICG
jgi:transposase